jgi:anti-sigma regulatory factor (Ser/Thr protein kinase)
MEEILSVPAVIRSPDRSPGTGQVAVTATFTRDSLGKVCTLVRTVGVRAGIAPRDIEDLLIAVSEVVTNAIRYGGGTGSITVRRLTGGLVAEIRDCGPGLPDTLTAGRLVPDIPVGGGLSRARLLCEKLDVLSSPLGVTVRMFTPCRAAT